MEADFFNQNENLFKKKSFYAIDKDTKGFLTYSINNLNFTEKLKLRSRGEERKKRCTLPPFRIKFKKESKTSWHFFNGRSKKLKLVTHCKLEKDLFGKKIADQEVLFEYFTYKIIENLTPSAFKTHLVKITYKDKTFGDFSKGYGFFIEDKADLGRRLNLSLKDISKEELKGNLFKSNFFELVFSQRFIGNYDWNINRNLIFAINKNLVIIPYDFDKSNLVQKLDTEFNYKSLPWDPNIISLFEELNISTISHDLISESFLQWAQGSLSKKKLVMEELEKIKVLLTESNYLFLKGYLTGHYFEIENGLKNNAKFYQIQDLIEDLKNNGKMSLANAAFALGWLKETKAISPLIETFKKEKDPELKSIIISTLGKIGGEKASSFLSSTIFEDNSLLIRMEALNTLLSLGQNAFLNSLLPQVNKSSPSSINRLLETMEKNPKKEYSVFLGKMLDHFKDDSHFQKRISQLVKTIKS